MNPIQSPLRLGKGEPIRARVARKQAEWQRAAQGSRRNTKTIMAGMRSEIIERSCGDFVLRWDGEEGGNYAVEGSFDPTSRKTVPAASPSLNFHRVHFDGVDAYGVIQNP